MEPEGMEQEALCSFMHLLLSWERGVSSLWFLLPGLFAFYVPSHWIKNSAGIRSSNTSSLSLIEYPNHYGHIAMICLVPVLGILHFCCLVAVVQQQADFTRWLLPPPPPPPASSFKSEFGRVGGEERVILAPLFPLCAFPGDGVLGSSSQVDGGASIAAQTWY